MFLKLSQKLFHKLTKQLKLKNTVNPYFVQSLQHFIYSIQLSLIIEMNRLLLM